jgi:hypothetical protein
MISGALFYISSLIALGAFGGGGGGKGFGGGGATGSFPYLLSNFCTWSLSLRSYTSSLPDFK